MNSKIKTISVKWIVWALGLLGISLVFAYVSNDFSSISGWLSFFVVFIFLSLITLRIWKYFQNEKAGKYLFILLIVAIVIRLAIGMLWFITLPEFGYDTEVQKAGYVMLDAYGRDTAAWEFSQTDEPLLKAFQGYSYTDQYGGLIFLSAFVYRYIGADAHQPLLMAVVSAFVSSLAVLFVWGISKINFGEKVAKLSAWFLVLYPEAILLGSSQMREAYSITLMVMIVFIFMRYLQNRKRKELIFLILGLILSLSLSTPFAFSVLLILGILIVWNLDWSWMQTGNRWLKLFGLVMMLLVFLIGLILVVDKVYGVDYQEYLNLQASGKITALFVHIPEWLHRPFLVVYGVVRPLLPAALADFGNIIWSSLEIWRAVGWTMLLTLLLYSTFLVFKEKVFNKLPGAMMLFTWFGVLTASFRGAGDDWDNPRYRVVIAGLHIVLAAWAYIKSRETKDPWLRRGIGFVASMLIWFMVWYYNRNINRIGFPLGDLSLVVGLGLACGVLFLVWDWLRTLKNSKIK